MGAADVVIDIIANDSFSSVLGSFGNIMTGIESTVQLAKQAFDAIEGAIAPFVTSASESETAVTRLNTVLASAGAGFNYTSQQLQDMATAMMDMSGNSDEAEMAAEAMLLRFENLNNIFPQALQLTNDLSASLGIDLTAAARMVGMALDDPEQGIGRLNSAYRIFDDTQIQVIKDMAASGDVAGAQALIMDALTQKFGGAAEAIGNTFAGSLAIAKEKLDNMRETIGGAFLPILQILLDKFMSFMDTNPIIQGVLHFFELWTTYMNAGAAPMGAFGLALENLEGVTGPLEPLMNALGNAFLIVSNAMQDGVPFIDAVNRALEDLQIAISQDPADLGWLGSIVTAIQDFIHTGQTEGWGTAFSDLFNQIIASLNIPGRVQSMLDMLTTIITAYPGWHTIGVFIADLISQVITLVLEGLDTIVNGINWTPLGNALAGALGQVGTAMGAALRQKFIAEVDPYGPGWNWLDTFGDTLLAVLWPTSMGIRVSSWAREKFGEIGTAIQEGVSAGLQSIGFDWWVTWWTDHVITPVKRLLGISSPSTVFAGIGHDVIQGFLDGLENTWQSVTSWFTTKFTNLLNNLTWDNILKVISGQMSIADLFAGASGGSTGSHNTGGTTTGGGTSTGSGTGGNTFQFYNCTFNVGSMEDIVYDCLTPNPFVASTSMSTMGTLGHL